MEEPKIGLCRRGVPGLGTGASIRLFAGSDAACASTGKGTLGEVQSLHNGVFAYGQRFVLKATGKTVSSMGGRQSNKTQLVLAICVRIKMVSRFDLDQFR